MGSGFINKFRAIIMSVVSVYPFHKILSLLNLWSLYADRSIA